MRSVPGRPADADRVAPSARKLGPRPLSLVHPRGSGHRVGRDSAAFGCSKSKKCSTCGIWLGGLGAKNVPSAGAKNAPHVGSAPHVRSLVGGLGAKNVPRAGAKNAPHVGSAAHVGSLVGGLGAENVPSAGAKNVPRAKNAPHVDLCRWIGSKKCSKRGSGDPVSADPSPQLESTITRVQGTL